MKKRKIRLQGQEVGTRVYILGGCNKDGIGANCKVIEVLNSDGNFSRVMIDSGVQLANTGKYDTIMADVSDFFGKGDEKPQKPLDAVLVTHTHADHIDGLMNFFKLGYKFPPVYTGGYTKALMEKFMYETGKSREDFPEIKVMESGDSGVLKINHSIEAKALNVSHTTSDALGFYIGTYVDGHFDQGILDMGDFHTRRVLLGHGFDSGEFSEFVKNNKITAVFIDSTSLMYKKERGEDVSVLLKNIEEAMRSQRENRLVLPVISRSNELMAIFGLAAANAGRDIFIRGDTQKKAYEATKRSEFFRKKPVSEEQKQMLEKVFHAVYSGEFSSFAAMPLEKQAIFISGAFGDKKIRSDGVNLNSQYIVATEGLDQYLPLGKNLTFMHGQREIPAVDVYGNVAKGKEKAHKAGCVIIENEADDNKYISILMQESGHIYPGELQDVLQEVYKYNPNVRVIPEHGSRIQRKFAMNAVKRVTRNIAFCDNGAYLFAATGISPLEGYNKSNLRFIGTFEMVDADGISTTYYDAIGGDGRFFRRFGEYTEPKSIKGRCTADELKPKYKKLLENGDEMPGTEKIKRRESDPKKRKKAEYRYNVKVREEIRAAARKNSGR